MTDHHRKGLAKRIWLLLCHQGGRWIEAEIRKELALDRGIHAQLGEMVRDGFLSRFRFVNVDDEVTVSYGLTKTCKVPRGVRWEEIQDLMLRAPPAPPKDTRRVKPDHGIRGRPMPARVEVVVHDLFRVAG